MNKVIKAVENIIVFGVLFYLIVFAITIVFTEAHYQTLERIEVLNK